MMNKQLSIAEVASILNCSKEVVNAHIRSGRLKATDIGTGSRHHFRIDPDELERFRAGRIAQEPKPVLKRNRRKIPQLI